MILRGVSASLKLFELNFESAVGHEPATISSYLRIILIRFYVSYTSFKSWCTQFVPISFIASNLPFESSYH